MTVTLTQADVNTLMSTHDTALAAIEHGPVRYNEEEAGEPPCTDVGNAHRFVIDHHLDVRYVHTWKKWLQWDGTRWAVDGNGEIIRRALDTIRGLYDRAPDVEDQKERQKLARWALTSEAEPKIRAMVKLASCDLAVAIEAKDIDQQPWYLNVLNGTLDLRTGKLLPHSRVDLITKLAPVTYTGTSECPRFMTFLEEILPVPEVRKFVQAGVGYSLTGITTERCLFIPYGKGANGKSTLLEVIRRLLGDYARQADVSTFMLTRNDSGPRPEVVRLAGARFVSSVEVEEGRRLAESLVKALTGNDTIAARGLYTDVVEFQPAFKAWLGTNHKPEIRGTDNAIWDRIRLIPFDVTIPPERQDRSLLDTLTTELSGILTWAVQGCLEWQRDGLNAPDAVRAATAGYREEMDTVQRFLDEHCEISPAVSIKATALYHTYKESAKDGGERPMTQTKFGRRMADLGYKAEKAGASGLKYYSGLFVEGTP